MINFDKGDFFKNPTRGESKFKKALNKKTDNTLIKQMFQDIQL